MEGRIVKVLLFFFIFFDVIYASELDLNSDKYIIYNMNDNIVLDSKDENIKTDIASLTKIMTVIVAIENIEDFDEKIEITSEMVKGIDWDVVTVGFKKGDIVTYNDLLYGSIISSGADAVKALSILVSGSEKKFVELMNDKVKELNLENTHFENVIGLYSKDNYSSAYDMAQILIYALKNDKFKEVFNTKSYTLSNGKKLKSTIEKYNSSSKSDISFITGSKTGYIKVAGYCLASTAELNNVNFLLITLNAFSKESSVHIKDHINAYTYYDNNYSYKNIVEDNSEVVTLKTKYAKEKSININANTTIKKYLKNDFDISKVKYEYSGIDTISYFDSPDIKLGRIKITYNNEVLDEFDLYYKQVLHFSIISFLLINYWIIIIFVIVVFLLLRVLSLKKRKKHHKKSLSRMEYL